MEAIFLLKSNDKQKLSPNAVSLPMIVISKKEGMV